PDVDQSTGVDVDLQLVGHVAERAVYLDGTDVARLETVDVGKAALQTAPLVDPDDRAARAAQPHAATAHREQRADQVLQVFSGIRRIRGIEDRARDEDSVVLALAAQHLLE